MPFMQKSRKKSGKNRISGMTEKKNFVYDITPEDAEKLRALLEERSFLLSPLPHALYKGTKDKVNVVAYESGKLVVQGSGAPEFVEFLLEPEILKERAFQQTGEGPQKEKNAPGVELAGFSAHAGIDESGKGDFFGPLVIACAFVPDAEKAKLFAEKGVRDSKLIKSDDAILKIASFIRNTLKDACSLVAIGPEAYNNLYEKVGNLNRLLAWGHAKALSVLLEKHPECTRALSDQFADEHLVRNAFRRMHPGEFQLEQHVRAESDVAVAAASILARAEFVRRIRLLEEKIGLPLPKGAGLPVDRAAKQIAVSGGEALLRTVAKMHFRTAYRALGLPEPERKTFFGR